MKVSVIVPVYNGGRYLKGLYSALLEQTIQDFEIVFVNDGSTDDSLKILEKIKEQDSRVVLVNKTNGGICSARNAGICASKGEYLVFLDQDDGIDNLLIERYKDVLEDSKADMAVFGKIHHYIDNEKIVSVSNESFDDVIVQDTDLLRQLILNVDNKNRFSTIWNCIYKSNIVKNENILFDEHFKHGDEDGMFNAEYVLKVNRVAFSSECHYKYYLRNNQSTISKPNNNLIVDYLYFINKLKFLLGDNNYDLFCVFALRFFSNVYKRYCRFNNGKEKKVLFLNSVMKDSCFRTVINYSCFFSSVSSLYWSVYCFMMRNNIKNVCIWMLDLILFLKRVKGQK